MSLSADSSQFTLDSLAHGLLIRLTMIKPFEDLTREWAPRVRRLISLITAEVSMAFKEALPAVLKGSVFLIASLFSAVVFIAWISGAAWLGLQETGVSPLVSSLLVAGGFAILTLGFFLGAKAQAKKPLKPIQILGRENGEIEEAGRELITLFKDLSIAAKHSISPNEMLKPHAMKAVAASAVVGFLIALTINPTEKEDSV